MKILIAVLLFVSCTTPPIQRLPATSGVDPNEEELHQLFKSVMLSRHGTKQQPKAYLGSEKVRRAVFLKPHGCAKGIFSVPSVPPAFRVGLFAEKTSKDVYVRFSSDTVPDTSDKKNSTVGISIKVLNVPGKKVLKPEEDFTTHDFLLQNHPVFFVNNARHFYLLFTDENAIAAEPGGQELLAKYKKILDQDMNHEVHSVLNTTYWSTTPYKFGDTRYARYMVKPCFAGAAEKPAGDANYLADRLKKDISEKGACFDFYVQLREKNEESTGLLEKSTEDWNSETFKPKAVAKIQIPPQNIDRHSTKCENMSFTAWHALPEHQPVGSINKARGIIYKLLGDYRRHERNGLPIEEPTE